MMKRISVIGGMCVIVAQLVVAGSPGDLLNRPSWNYREGLCGYALLVMPSNDETAFTDTYHIVRYESTREYQVIDSIDALDVGVVDSNKIVYIDVGATHTFLVSLTLSPAPLHDTLIAIKNDHPENWLQHISSLNGSCVDSVIAYSSDLDYVRSLKVGYEFKIIEYGPENEWRPLRTYGGLRTHGASQDFTELLLVGHDSSEPGGVSPGTLVIYDVQANTDTVYSGFEGSVERVRRRDRHSPVYYLLRADSVTKVIAWLPGQEAVNMFEYASSMDLVFFQLFCDSISVIGWSSANRADRLHEIIHLDENGYPKK